MKKSTLSLLLVAMMGLSGFAAAQSTTDVKSGTQGGAGPNGSSGMGDNAASKGNGTMTSPNATNQGGMKSGMMNSGSMNNGSMSSGSMNSKMKMTAEERKQARADRAAARKMRMAGKPSDGMAIGPTTATSGSPSTSSNAKSATIGQGQGTAKQSNGAQ